MPAGVAAVTSGEAAAEDTAAADGCCFVELEMRWSSESYMATRREKSKMDKGPQREKRKAQKGKPAESPFENTQKRARAMCTERGESQTVCASIEYITTKSVRDTVLGLGWVDKEAENHILHIPEIEQHTYPVQYEKQAVQVLGMRTASLFMIERG